MTSFSKIFSILFFLTQFCVSGFSQDKTSTKQEHILIAIEDSLRGKSFFGEDSTWLNLQLQLHNEPLKKENIKYKLVKIGKRNFTEGPHASLPDTKREPVISHKYGDSAFLVFGQKFYTYIGNSSWGYYPEYHLVRLYPAPLLEFKIPEPNTCEHGWDMRRGQACYQCLHNYRIKNDSSYRANDSIKKIISYPQMIDCNHGHICCQAQCPCCPKNSPIQYKPQPSPKK